MVFQRVTSNNSVDLVTPFTDSWDRGLARVEQFIDLGIDGLVEAYTHQA